MSLNDDEYVKEYRKILDKIQSFDKLSHRLEDDLERVNVKLSDLYQERNNMRRIITKIIDENIDLIEAKLKYDQSDTLPDFWQSNNKTNKSFGLQNNIDTTKSVSF